MQTYIPLIVGGIILLFILFGMIWGLIRGLKRTSFRLGWIFAFGVILFFVAPLVTMALMKMDISFLNINVNGQLVTSISELATYYLKQIPDFGEMLTEDPETLNIMLSLVALLLNSFVYVILFWLVKIVLWPIWAILSAIFIKKKNAKGEKKKKHAWWGLLVGAISGLFVGATTIMPVVGVASLATEIENSTKENYATTTTDENTGEEIIIYNGGVLTKLGAGEVVDILNYYNNSFVAKALKYTGIEFFQNASFSGLSSATLNNQRIVLKDEVKNMAVTFASVKNLQELGFNNLNQQKINELISASRILVNQMFNIKTLYALGDNLMPKVIDEILTNPEFIIQLPNTGEELFNQAIVDSVKELKKINFADVKNELINLLDIASLLNEKDIICKIANKEVTEAPDILKLFDETTLNNVTNKIFEMKTMMGFLPIVVNTSLNYVAEQLNVVDFEIDEEGATVEEVKNLFKNLTTTVLAINNSINYDSKYYITETTLPLVGELLNAVKNYGGLNQENYNKLVVATENRLRTEVNKLLSNVSADLADVKEEILKSINNLSEVSNFEADFTKINEVYDDVILVVEGINSSEPTIHYESVGKVLDCFKQTELFGKAVNPIIESGLEYFKTKIPTEYAELNDVVYNVKLNIKEVNSWQNELKQMESFVNTIQDIMAASDLKTALLNENSTLMAEFGASLNKLNNTVLFKNEIKPIVKIVLNQVENLSIENTDLLTETFAVVRTNIDKSNNVNWEHEFVVLKMLVNNLMELSDEGSTVTIEEIGETFDNIVKENCALINAEVINSILKTTITQFAGSTTDSEILDIVETLKTEIDNSENLNYKQELTALNSLFNELNNIDSSSSTFLVDFGRLLDSYDYETGTSKSVLVSGIRTKIVTLVINKVNTSTMDADMVTIINKIKNNASNITNFETEFTYLDEFVNEVENLTSVNVETFEFAKFGRMLDGYSTSVLLGNVRSDVVTFIVNKVTITNAEQQIQTAINEILQNTILMGKKAENGEITFETLFSELGQLKSQTDNFANITFTKDNYDVSQFGTMLDNLNSLNIVPTISSVRIAKFITGKFVGENGIKQFIKDYSTHEAKDEIDNTINEVMSQIINIDTSYQNYITSYEQNENPTTEFNFTNDFNEINTIASTMVEKLKQYSLWG